MNCRRPPETGDELRTQERRARLFRLAVLASLAATLGAPLQGAAQYYRFAVPAPWVAPLEPDLASAVPAGSADASAFYLLLDRQIDIGPAGDDYYRHVAVKVLNSTGIDEYSQLDLVVDPAFQTLLVHRLRIVREGAVIDQEKLARITELLQETELRYRVYNGRYNIDIALVDVRAGDVIEYAFTVRSRDRFFPGLYYARFDTGWSDPVRHQRIRVRAPLDRQIVCRPSDGSAVPAPAAAGDRREFEFEWRDLAPIPAPGSTPGWYSAWPYLEVGDRGSWAHVAEIAEPLFRVPSQLGPRTSAALEAIRRPAGGPSVQALRALQYVQEEIRYMSLSMGRGGFEPASPELVVERRFGDCKDKSLLLATLLNRLGIEAQVALVHSSRGRALDDSLPSPYVFDHAIVRAAIEGGVYWLDPTVSTQYDPLSTSHHPDFERALPIGTATQGLETIPPPAPDLRRKEITATLDLKGGMTAPGTLEIETRFEGALADEMRPSLSGTSAEQRRTNYETYTAQYYPSARSIAPVDVDDDRLHGTLTLKEHYRLDSPFAADDEGVLKLTLHPDEIYSYVEPVGAGARQAPLAIEYPIQIRQRIVVMLPEDWPSQPETVSVDNAAFRYRSKVDYAERRLTLDYEYQSLAASVAAKDIGPFEADRARAYSDLGYVVSHKDPASLGGRPLAVAPLPLLVLIFTFAIAVWAAVRWGYRYDPPARAAPENSPSGIGGWLILPALSMVGWPFVAGWIAITWSGFVEADAWHGFPAIVGGAYAGSAHLVLLLILALAALLTVGAGLTTVLFFSKRTSAPRVLVAFTWFSVLLLNAVIVWTGAAGIGEAATASGLGGGFLRDILTAGLWTAYLLTSKRVQATFIRRLKRRVPAVTADTGGPLTQTEGERG